MDTLLFSLFTSYSVLYAFWRFTYLVGSLVPMKHPYNPRGADKSGQRNFNFHMLFVSFRAWFYRHRTFFIMDVTFSIYLNSLYVTSSSFLNRRYGTFSTVLAFLIHVM